MTEPHTTDRNWEDSPEVVGDRTALCAREGETGDGTTACTIFDPSERAEPGTPTRWLTAEEGWYVDLEDAR